MGKGIVRKFNKGRWDSMYSPKFVSVSYEEFGEYRVKIHLAIITANDVEKKAVDSRLKNIPEYNCKFSVVYNNQTYYIARFGVFNVVVIKLGSTGIHAPDAAMLSVYELIQTWTPFAIVAVGVAMGMKPEKQNYGDVVISKEIVNYNIFKSTSEGDVCRSPRPIANNALYDRFTNCLEWSFKDEKNQIAKTYPGLVITGAVLVNNEDVTQQLKNDYPDAVGNEMEASGIWAASERNNVPWIVVKGISDWGKKKSDDFQPLAATSAVSLCETVFSKKDALSGIMKTPKKKNQTTRKINSLKLFFFRKGKGLTEKELGKIAKIDELNIIKYESLNIAKGIFDLSCFPDCNILDIHKLENALELQNNSLEAKENSVNYMGYLLSFYYKSRFNKIYNNVRAVVFDFDGTLTKSESKMTTWQRIWTELGYPIEECDKLHKKFDDKEITHQQWCELTCQKFQSKNLSKNTLSEISSCISLVEGCAPTLRKLKSGNLSLFIVSGSVREIIIEVLGEEITHLFDRIQANRMEFSSSNGELKRIIGTRYDFEGKCNFIIEIAKELNIQPYEILFVGNSDNDELAHKSGAITLCVNPISTNGHNIKIWNNRIENMRNLSDILPYVITER